MIRLPSRFGWIHAPRLTQEGERSLYFGRIWIYSALIAVLAGIVLDHYPLALVGFFVLATATGSSLWNRYALNDVMFEVRSSAHRAFPGDIVELDVTLANEKPLPLPEITVNLSLSEALEPIGVASTVEGASTIRTVTLRASLRPFETRTWRIRLDCTRRGPWSVGPATLRSSDPFGFFSSRRAVGVRQDVFVYPHSFAIHEPPARNERLMGPLTARRRLVTDPMRRAGVRDYHPDDPFRTINWKATARTGGLKVNVNDPVVSTVVMIVLNLDTFTHYWEGLAIEQSERAIETAASIARWGIEQQISVGISTNGLTAGYDTPLRIPPGRGLHHQAQIMSGLARLWAFSTVPVANILRQERVRGRRDVTYFIVSPMTSPAIDNELRLYTLAGIDPIFVPVGEAALHPPAGVRLWSVELPEQETSA
ncbi:MAG TPA: DUF58 domain-containing protein [Thermomicrobiales bacterium]|nr:DUF58 domain-containing protein [Thermomicrobiales bacterium]